MSARRIRRARAPCSYATCYTVETITGNPNAGIRTPQSALAGVHISAGVIGAAFSPSPSVVTHFLRTMI